MWEHRDCLGRVTSTAAQRAGRRQRALFRHLGLSVCRWGAQSRVSCVSCAVQTSMYFRQKWWSQRRCSAGEKASLPGVRPFKRSVHEFIRFMQARGRFVRKLAKTRSFQQRPKQNGVKSAGHQRASGVIKPSASAFVWRVGRGGTCLSIEGSWSMWETARCVPLRLWRAATETHRDTPQPGRFMVAVEVPGNAACNYL